MLGSLACDASRTLRQPHELTTTKPGRLLKKQIPVRTFTEWAYAKPRFLEADLVATTAPQPAVGGTVFKHRTDLFSIGRAH